ncbi:MAG: ABC transporter substrate-binding protein [Firmicutes bacterium]|jgi:putative spermidine/putrescine transport system substrate-binding protein|nr:ABC transporter substrate-binding protein [Bacillota bacterium]
MKKIIVMFLIVFASMSFIACQKEDKVQAFDLSQASWEDILKEARGTSVSFYGWGGSQRVNEWLDNEVADYLYNQYEIKLDRVPMNIDEILNKLLGEKQLDAEGTIDVVWINGENFSTAKSNDLLYGSFTDKLPNFKKYVDSDSREANFDFGYSIDGYEAPFGKAQFVLIADGNEVELPRNHEALKKFVMENPGMVTYPALPDFVGSAFVRNIIYDVVGFETVKDLPDDKEAVREAIQPAIDYLLDLKPYLWQEGRTYPATSALLDNMYSDGEVLLTMTYNPNHVAGKIQTSEFKESSQAFLFDKGTIGNTHYLAIADNGKNKAAALVLINAILSPELQASKYDPELWGDLPVLDNSKLSEEEKEIFNSIPLGKGVPSQEELLEKRVPELPVYLIPHIEEIWMETIPGE